MNLISVIVPVYNSEHYLQRCLDSIVAQSYDNLEIILVDDGSTDRSSFMCDEFVAKESRAIVIHQPNIGLWAARKTGHEASHGDYLYFLDSDDYFHKDTLRILYEAINSGSGYELAIAGRKRTSRVDEDVSSVVTPILEEWSQQRLMETMISEKDDPCCVYMWNKLYRRSIIKDIRPRRYLRSEDLDFNLRVFLRLDKAIVVKNALYYWFQREGSLIHVPEAMDIYYECCSDIYYRNFMDLTQDGREYGPLLLRRLYRKMIIWRFRKWRTANREAVVKTCHRYVKDTSRTYLLCSGIPLFERFGVFTLITFPRLAFLILKTLGN